MTADEVDPEGRAAATRELNLLDAGIRTDPLPQADAKEVEFMKDMPSDMLDDAPRDEEYCRQLLSQVGDFIKKSPMVDDSPTPSQDGRLPPRDRRNVSDRRTDPTTPN